MCAACAAYERLTALFGVCGVGWRQPNARGCGGRQGPRGRNRAKRVKNLPPEKATDFSLFWHIQNCRRSPAYQLHTPVQGLRALPGGVGARSPHIKPATIALNRTPAPKGTPQCDSPSHRHSRSLQQPPAPNGDWQCASPTMTFFKKFFIFTLTKYTSNGILNTVP